MSEETKQSWRAEQIAEYARLGREINVERHEMDTDPERNRLIEERVKLSNMIELLEGTYFKTIETAQQQQAGIKAELVDRWLSTEDKTFECTAGTATLRTTKSLHIHNKQKLIDFLTRINKLPGFIKTFEITKLRKIKDAGLLGDEIATWDEKKSIAIKIAEVGK